MEVLLKIIQMILIIILLMKIELENVTLPNDYFDIIYMIHTLEHLKSPNEIFFKIKSALKSDGILYIEVPNIELI